MDNQLHVVKNIRNKFSSWFTGKPSVFSKEKKMHIPDQHPIVFLFKPEIGGYEHVRNGIRIRLFEVNNGWDGQICWMGTHPTPECPQPCDNAASTENKACLCCDHSAKKSETTMYHHETVDKLADFLRGHLSGAMDTPDMDDPSYIPSPCIDTVLALSAWRLVHDV